MPTRQEVAAVSLGLRLIDSQDDPALRASLSRSVAAALHERFDMTPEEVAEAAAAVRRMEGTAGSAASLARTDVSHDDDEEEDHACEDDGSSCGQADDDEDELELAASETFDVEVVEEHALDVATAAPETSNPSVMSREVPNGPSNERRGFGMNFLRPRPQRHSNWESGESTPPPTGKKFDLADFFRPRHLERTDSKNAFVEMPKVDGDGAGEDDANPCTDRGDAPIKCRKFDLADFFRPPQLERTKSKNAFMEVREPDGDEDGEGAAEPCTDRDDTPNECSIDCCENDQRNPPPKRRSTLLQTIADDCAPHRGGDLKILRAIGRTAAVNAAVLVTAATGGAAGAVGYAAGGAITSKRLVDGMIAKDDKEVTKSLAVYGCATGASVAGQAIAGAVMIGLAGASLPLAGAVAFGVGCCSGITAGALSEWTVDKCMDDEGDSIDGAKKRKCSGGGCIGSDPVKDIE